MGSIEEVRAHLAGQIAKCEKDLAAMHGDLRLGETRLAVFKDAADGQICANDQLLGQMNQAEGARDVLQTILGKLPLKMDDLPEPMDLPMSIHSEP